MCIVVLYRSPPLVSTFDVSRENETQKIAVDSGLCEQYVKSLASRTRDLIHLSHAPLCIVATNPSRSGSNPLNITLHSLCYLARVGLVVLTEHYTTFLLFVRFCQYIERRNWTRRRISRAWETMPANRSRIFVKLDFCSCRAENGIVYIGPNFIASL